MRYDVGLGYQLNKKLWRGKEEGRGDEVVWRMCVEVGVEPVGWEGAWGSKELVKVVRERSERLCGDIGATAEGVFTTMAEEEGTLDPSQLPEVYLMLSACLGKTHPTERLNHIARVQSTTPLPITLDIFTQMYVTGPLAVFDFPPHWWAAPNPTPLTHLVSYGVLSRPAIGIFIEYTTRKGETRTLKIKSRGGEGLKKIVETRTGHLLNDQQRETLGGIVGGVEADEWETVDVQLSDLPVNLDRPDYHTLKYHGTKDVNLNEVDNDLLDEYKGVMNETFNKAAIREDDPNFKYDTRFDVKPVEKSEWDSSDEEENS